MIPEECGFGKERKKEKWEFTKTWGRGKRKRIIVLLETGRGRVDVEWETDVFLWENRRRKTTGNEEEYFFFGSVCNWAYPIDLGFFLIFELGVIL